MKTVKRSRKPDAHALELRAMVAYNIRKWAKRRGLSQHKLAARAGVSLSQVSYVLARTTSVRVSWLNKIANALDVEIETLMKP